MRSHCLVSTTIKKSLRDFKEDEASSHFKIDVRFSKQNILTGIIYTTWILLMATRIFKFAIFG